MIEIIPMTLEHLDEIHGIELRSFSIPWSKNEFRREITENQHAYYFVAADRDNGNRLAGYAGIWHIVNEGHITNIAVDELYKRQGVGSLLMERLFVLANEKEMIGLTLEVRMGNRPAHGLYHKYGFKAEGIRKNYYVDTHEDAVIMWRYFERNELAGEGSL